MWFSLRRRWKTTWRPSGDSHGWVSLSPGGVDVSSVNAEPSGLTVKMLEWVPSTPRRNTMRPPGVLGWLAAEVVTDG
jgi:hypothetical protein